ncbi:hypothetical protein [Rugosimonospora africana]|uniref:Uncharacterized protein n=1 Tax=Rugosimonospora africana TaxID=556532 RepID=A0A8J3VWJ4_9ACTN|nr:hypothetical protein [Rugosimonospora africana]GIH20921.1 hypothetical protein Raf01_90930 [Rugosimonospora africana]
MQTLLDRYEQATQRLPIAVTSPGGWVTVRRSETGEVSVTLRRHTLARITERELAAELRHALNDAYRTYRDECRKLRRAIFGPDYDEIHTRSGEWAPDISR